jgi:adenosylmethionine-8-amino-7-oxononanoate aminotransferase
MKKLARLDHQYLWHPFTQMRDWLKRPPILIVSGKGATLWDVNGKEYLDANASIWTNLHGHAHPQINKAIQRQLGKIAHSSALGLANEPAALLGEKLVQAAGLKGNRSRSNPLLEKVFFSDDGSTAIEVALKLAYQYAQRTGFSKNPKFLSLSGAYHGDTIGAVSLGHIDLFHKAYSGLLFRSDKLPAPYCYRCPFNKAKPERADAREYVHCKRECVALARKAFAARKKKGEGYAGFLFEPLIQGAAGMIAHPAGYLSEVTNIARANGALLIADEVMTGFGRTGTGASPLRDGPQLFACQREGVQPDFLALAKGLTGGYLPMAATLTTQKVFDAFLGEYEQFKTFFHGHSYTGNQLGASAALASLKILESSNSIQARQMLEDALRNELSRLWALPQVGDIRQVGLVAGIELVKDWKSRKPFALHERAGIRVCDAMAKRGVLTRPIGNVIVLMPPYCTTSAQLRKIVSTLAESISRIL